MAVGIITGALIFALAEGDFYALEAITAFFLRLLAVTSVLFLLFVFRMIGAGDIKLAALICGYLGFRTGFTAIGCGFFIGAFWSFLYMAVTGCFISRFSYFLAYFRSLLQTRKITAYYAASRDGYDAVIPLGFCMFLGTLFAVIFF